MNLHRLQPSIADNADTNKPHLTLIHGWASESEVWQSWAKKYFADDYQLTLIDLPGFGQSPALANSDTLLDDWIEALNQALPNQPTHLIGWSLGGLLAQQLALKYPNKVKSLICMASTPRFTQNDGWQKSVSPTIIADFIKAVQIETNSLLKKFWRLQFQGSDQARDLMKRFGKQMAMLNTPSLQGLQQGLFLLRDMDNRADLTRIQAPTLWVLGEKDPLIPIDIRANLADLQPQARIETIAGGSHIPFFSEPKATAQAITQFLKKL